MKTPEEKRWERLRELLLAESNGNAPIRISSQRTLFGIKSHVEEVIEKCAREDSERCIGEMRKRQDGKRDMIKIRKAAAEDLSAVEDFYHMMIDVMEGSDFDVLWRHGEHPTDEYISDRIDDGLLYIGTIDQDGFEKIACALAVDQIWPDGFEKAPWILDVVPEDTWIIHIVATDPQYHGRGFGKILVEKALEDASKAGIKSVRLDTFANNVRGQRLYEKCGFNKIGPIDVFYEYLGNIRPLVYEYVVGLSYE